MTILAGMKRKRPLMTAITNGQINKISTCPPRGVGQANNSTAMWKKQGGLNP